MNVKYCLILPFYYFSEIVVNALRNTQVEFSLAHYPTCPRLRRITETPSRMLPTHYDSMVDRFPMVI